MPIAMTVSTSRRYQDGQPHWLMQCASSITTPLIPSADDSSQAPDVGRQQEVEVASGRPHLALLIRPDRWRRCSA
jgi:hypothetical protein